MELRRYGQIIWRYWPVVLVLTLIGVGAAALYWKSSPPAYQAATVVNVFQSPSPNDTYSGIYAAQVSEYSADDMIKVIQGNTFTKAVSDRLKESQINLPADDLKGMLSVERKNRELTITATSSDQATALQVARMVGQVLQTDAASYLKGRQLNVTILDTPSAANASGGRTTLLAGVRVLAGLLAGLGLALLLAYLNNSVRTKNEAEELLGLPVLGVLPRFTPTAGQTLPQNSQTSAKQPEQETVSSRQ